MAGRPKMTEAEKAAAKEKREAAKAGAGEAADRAEARSANGKAAAEKPKPQPAQASIVNSDDLDAEEKALFLNHHLPAVRKARKAVADATSALRNAYKKAKAEGNFTKADFDTAFAVETAEAEARERAKIARSLRIARIMGSSLGRQLDMFLEPDRTPASEIAFEEGEKDALQNISGGARPKYDPSTEQYREYMRGFHSVSEKRINSGISKLHPEVEKDAERVAGEKATVDQQKAVDAMAFEKADNSKAEAAKPATPAEKAAAAQQEIPANPTPASGTPMTRAQFKAQEELRKAQAAGGGDEGSAFQKRTAN